MQSQRWQDKQIAYGRLVRILFIGLTILFFLSAGIILVLNVGGKSLSNSLIAVFAVLGALFSFLQWYVPRSPSQASVALLEPTISPQSLSAEDEAYRSFIEGERQRLYDSPNLHNTGTLVVRANKAFIHEAIIVGSKTCMISERTEIGRVLYIGIIKNIPEGNHVAQTIHGNSRAITIHAREVTEIDLRNEH